MQTPNPNSIYCISKHEYNMNEYAHESIDEKKKKKIWTKWEWTLWEEKAKIPKCEWIGLRWVGSMWLWSIISFIAKVIFAPFTWLWHNWPTYVRTHMTYEAFLNFVVVATIDDIIVHHMCEIVSNQNWTIEHVFCIYLMHEHRSHTHTHVHTPIENYRRPSTATQPRSDQHRPPHSHVMIKINSRHSPAMEMVFASLRKFSSEKFELKIEI